MGIAFSWMGSVSKEEVNVFIQFIGNLTIGIAVGAVLLLVGHFSTPAL
jgi:hypothetical protein